MTASREQLLLRELEQHGWRKGEPVAVTLELLDADRADLAVGFVVAAQLLGRMSGTVRSLHLVADSPTPPRLGQLLAADGSLAEACGVALTRAARVPLIDGHTVGQIRLVLGEPASSAPGDL